MCLGTLRRLSRPSTSRTCDVTILSARMICDGDSGLNWKLPCALADGFGSGMANSSNSDQSAKPEYLYRFRSIDKLLGKKELERSEFRLASPSELNDPMEGYKDVVFRGDDVLWENLLRHYILALVSSTLNSMVLGDASSDAPDIRAALTADDLPT